MSMSSTSLSLSYAFLAPSINFPAKLTAGNSLAPISTTLDYKLMQKHPKPSILLPRNAWLSVLSLPRPNLLELIVSFQLTSYY